MFTQPAGPIKCAGAPQKIANLAADYWRRQGVLDDIRVVLVLPDPVMFEVSIWAAQLEKVADRYGIEVRRASELVSVDGAQRTVGVIDNTAGTKQTLPFDLLHVVPPQSAPDVIKSSLLADPASPFGYVEVDQHTLRHKGYRNVFALGDVANLRAALDGRDPVARYNGYTSCPLVTARDKMLLAEFDYDRNPTLSIPFISTTKERRDMLVLKRYALPALYWHGVLNGIA